MNPTTCTRCSSEYEEGTLACPACGTLVHGEKLAELFASFRDMERNRELEKCLSTLMECLKLLPPETVQYQQIQSEFQRISHLYTNQPVEVNPSALVSPEIDGLPNSSSGNFILGAFRSFARGLTRPSTLISLLIWTISLSWIMGWKSALALGLLIYVHEMGHLLAIQYYGYHFSWPIFVPFLGAFVLRGKAVVDRRESLVISAAGPLAGSLASGVLFVIPLLIPETPPEITRFAFLNLMLNLVNLLPVWVLDGARIAQQCTRPQLLTVIGCLSGSGILAYFLLGTPYTFALVAVALGWVFGAVAHWVPARGAASRPGNITFPLAGVVLLLITITCLCVRFRP